MRIFEKSFKLLDILENFGEAYLVGGCVRDFVLGKVPNDVDLATNIPIEVLEKLFDTVDIGKNKKFGVLVVKFENEIYEIAQFRKDGIYLDGRRPEEITIVNTIEEDLSRRDFTINAMAMDKYGNIIDPFDGIADLRNKKLKTVGEAEQRFSEDYIRILRAIRFANKFDLTYDHDLKQAIINNSSKISNLCVERIHQELFKMASFNGEKFANCVEDLYKFDCLKYIYPEIHKLSEFKHDLIHHPESENVFYHVIAALKQYSGNDPIINFSILFHDVGKILTYKFDEEKQKHTYYEHDKFGIDLIKDISQRHKWPNYLTDTVSFCAKQHMRFHNFSKMARSKIVKLIIDKNWNVLYEVAKADTLCKGEIVGETEWNPIEQIISEICIKYSPEKMKEIREVINGNFIMENKQINNPKEIGYYLDSLIDIIVNCNIDILNIEKIKSVLSGINLSKEYL